MPKGHHHLESNESSSHDSSSSHSGRRNRRPERLLKWFDFDETKNCLESEKGLGLFSNIRAVYL